MHSVFSRKKSSGTSNAPPADDFGRAVSSGSFAPSDGFIPFTTDRLGDGLEAGAGYGYLSYERHVVLHPEQVSVLVDVVASELGSRGGITTPFIFSSSALDTSTSGIKRLIRTFLDAQLYHTEQHENKWREEARFANPHDLGMFMRWGLARVVRFADGREERGIVPWDHYTAFRDSEVAANYPAQHFSTFLPPLLPPVRSIIITVLSVLARLTANSTSSGHTPPTLSPLFGGLFFGLGVLGAPFHHTYVYYLRATNAMEHIILSFIRFQDTAKLGVPTRLKEWIKGYPIMLPSQSPRPEPRKGARTVRLVSVRRNVRHYSHDLIRTASTWECDVLHGPLRYSDTYRKRMDMPPSFEAEAVGSTMQSAEQQRFKSLNDFKWGEFAELGFSGLNDGDKKLQFDLTETARSDRFVKRSTLSWNDFSSDGFTRTDISPLMEFSPALVPHQSPHTDSPANGKKLKKSAKAPVFNWDTTPVGGQEEVVEEAFLDAFCDIVCSWPTTDIEAERECNWAMIEFRPNSLFLFEEFVPQEYRQQLYGASVPRKRLPSLFSSSSSTPSSPISKKMNRKNLTSPSTTTIGGRTTSRNAAAEVDFEGLLRGDGGRKTKVIRLGGTSEVVTSPAQSSSNGKTSQTLTPTAERAQDTPLTPSKSNGSDTARRRFRPSLSNPITPRKSIISGVPSEATTVDFETRMASLDSDDYEDYPTLNGPVSRRNDDDSWVDILVGSQERRMAGQQYDMSTSRRGAREPSGGGDPDLVSLEVEKAMQQIPRDLSASPEVPAPMPGVNLGNGAYQDDGDDYSVEIETVPRRRSHESGSTYTEQSLARDGDTTSMADTLGDEAEEEEEEEPKPTTRRLTYFDLHPDRRPGGAAAQPSSEVRQPEPTSPAPSTPEIAAPVPSRSKTASLIDLYREKEKAASPGSSPVAAAKSVLPVVKTPPQAEPIDILPPPPLIPDAGRESPARYVHGAPLHNVLEEEEEED
ncbi:hypothetical protein CYLTODRAFT_448003 [Cylindrobasidium torrendii FP15055 ss-10]|uniref:Meiotically up-regulated protein Msb1/Mug8 domain-containing protein n=1 Tax=Cylindrobasidium torrendii FP15055 ss-10 TaxID=1314674 RepID=A0A0D7BUR8_9AGAR|nr:hypothetical protein CYLTODRAFT_448003 [Cylindrobasidium torrendii FP15055 ss-10]